MKPSSSSPLSLQGFTLTEVALAIGIISFALVAILGLLSTIMSAEQGVSNHTFSSQMAVKVIQTIKADRTASPGDPKPDFYTFYYSVDGNRVSTGDNAAYLCDVTLGSAVLAGVCDPGDFVRLVRMEFRKPGSTSVIQNLHATLPNE